MAKKPELKEAVHVPRDEAREEARRNPGGWVYKIEGDFGPQDAIPREAIVGAWEVDENGNTTGDFILNPNYCRANAPETGEGG